MTAHVSTTASEVTAADVRPIYSCEHADGHVSVCVGVGPLAIWFHSIDELGLWWAAVGIEMTRYQQEDCLEDASIGGGATIQPPVRMDLDV